MPILPNMYFHAPKPSLNIYQKLGRPGAQRQHVSTSSLHPNTRIDGLGDSSTGNQRTFANHRATAEHHSRQVSIQPMLSVKPDSRRASVAVIDTESKVSSDEVKRLLPEIKMQAPGKAVAAARSSSVEHHPLSHSTSNSLGLGLVSSYASGSLSRSSISSAISDGPFAYAHLLSTQAPHSLASPNINSASFSGSISSSHSSNPFALELPPAQVVVNPQRRHMRLTNNIQPRGANAEHDLEHIRDFTFPATPSVEVGAPVSSQLPHQEQEASVTNLTPFNRQPQGRTMGSVSAWLGLSPQSTAVNSPRTSYSPSGATLVSFADYMWPPEQRNSVTHHRAEDSWGWSMTSQEYRNAEWMNRPLSRG